MRIAVPPRLVHRTRLVATGQARRALVPAALLALVASAGRAQGPGPEARHPVLGRVGAADETRLVGAHVVLTTGGAPARQVTTREDGQFRFDDVPDGTATLVVRRLGFQSETLAVEVPQPPGGPVVVLLSRVARSLPQVVVRAVTRRASPRAALERREAQGFGHFVTRSEIEHRSPQRTSDLLRGVPGVTLVSTGGGSSTPRFRATGRAGLCEPSYWIDGAPLAAGGFDIDALSPRGIDEIEIYNGAATVPSALRGSSINTSSCGVISIWMRQGAPPDQLAPSPAADSLDDFVARGTVRTSDQVDMPALPLPGAEPSAAYPDSLRAAHVAGRAVVEFVVDETGQVDASTIGVVSSTHPLFAEAARMAVASARFSPALAAGRTVRQVVTLPFAFEPGVAPPAPSSPAPSPR